jgi:ribosome-associated toxin RatA of RatAB toxin-antitoxin module
MPAACHSILIRAPADKVFDAIVDYESYPQFLKEVKSAKVVRRSGAEVDVRYELSLIKTIRYTLRMREERPHRIAWSFVEGEVMKDNHGTWELKPEEGGSIRATYTIEVALGPLVPKALIQPLVESSLPGMLEALKKRVEG